MKPSPIADQVRQLREQRFADRARAMMTPRSAPSPAKVKEIADRAEAKSDTKAAEQRMLAATGIYHPVKHDGAHVFMEKEKTKMPISAAPDWDKSSYMRLYQRVKRATTDEVRAAAEAALREAFPNKRPRAPSAPKANGDAAPKPAMKAERSKPVPKKAVPRKPARKAKKAKKKGRR